MESTGITSFNTVFVIFHSPDIVTLLVKNKLQESSAAAERCEERTWFNVQRARQRETERKRERERLYRTSAKQLHLVNRRKI